MTAYHVVATLGWRPGAADEASEALSVAGGVACEVGFGPTGHVEVTFTVMASGLGEAVASAQEIVAPLQSIGLEVVPVALWGQRAKLRLIPDLLSVSEAAASLGVTRQAVLQRIETGSVQAVRIGHMWAIPRSAVKSAQSAG